MDEEIKKLKLDSYDLECPYESLNFTPVPTTEITFERILIKFDSDSGTHISKKFLSKLTSLRKELSTDIKKAPLYLKHLYPLYIVMSNDRASFRTIGIPQFAWTSCNSQVVASSCWRYELIMAGYAAAIQHLSEALSPTCTEGKARVAEITKAYSIFRYVCLEESEAWTRVNIMEVPLECTTHCCQFFASLCLCYMQRIALSFNELNKWENNTAPLKLSLWLFEESKLLCGFADSRIREGSGQFLKDLNHHILQVLRNESAVLVLAYSAMAYLEDKSSNNYGNATKLIEYAEKFARYNANTLIKHECPRHDASALQIQGLLNQTKEECEIANSSTIDVGVRLSVLNELDIRDQTLVWTLVQTNETKYWRLLKNFQRYISDKPIVNSMFFGIQFR